MAAPSNDIFEERKEVMVSLSGDSKPISRTAHFLKPTSTSMDELDLPLDHSISPLPSQANWPLKANFHAWKHHMTHWNAWVTRMRSMHQAAWEKAGIDEAILNTTYDVKKYPELIFGLSEKWCANTNTFIFPWGEATITLEDVMVLGGYSVLGSPVSFSVQNREWKMIEQNLMDARTEVCRSSKSRRACQGTWMEKFINGGSDIEHEAFLALWLSKFVFQNSCGTIRKEVFPIAIRLARGVSVALAPAVLASIYRDLSQLKGAIVANREAKVQIFSPFLLVQFWAWERFPVLQPKPKMLNFGEPRSARWNKVNILKVENVRFALDSAGEFFLWRPYAKSLQNWSSPKFYKDKEEMVLVDSESDIHLEAFARCLRVSKICSFDYMENYFPHRVAMQFGMDQDLPGRVALPETRGVAWMNYSKAISDPKFYIPSRLFESDVTTRYLKWWKESVLGQRETAIVPIQQEGSLEQPKWDTKASKEMEEDRYPDFPPGFPPKISNNKELGILVEKDNPTAVKMLTQLSFGNGLIGNGELPGDQSQNVDSPIDDGGAVKETEAQTNPAQKISDNMVSMKASGKVMGQMEVEQENIAGSIIMTSNGGSINGSRVDNTSYKLEIDISELETRIEMLEEEVAKLKAARKLGLRVE